MENKAALVGNQLVSEDFLPIDGTDFIELIVGDAKQAAHYYQSAFGFQPLAYKGLETGDKLNTSYVLVQDKIRLVLTSPLTSDGEYHEHLKAHGDGVKVVALWVKDAKKSWEETTKRGAESYFEPKTIEDEHGKVELAGIHTYGDTVHVFVNRNEYNGPFLPGYVKWGPEYQPAPVWIEICGPYGGKCRLERNE